MPTYTCKQIRWKFIMKWSRHKPQTFMIKHLRWVQEQIKLKRNSTISPQTKAKVTHFRLFRVAIYPSNPKPPSEALTSRKKEKDAFSTCRAFYRKSNRWFDFYLSLPARFCAITTWWGTPKRSFTRYQISQSAPHVQHDPAIFLHFLAPLVKRTRTRWICSGNSSCSSRVFVLSGLIVKST